MSDAAPSRIHFQPASDQTLLVHFGEEISIETHRQVVSFLKLLEADPAKGVFNLHPAYCSVLVKFDALRFSHSEIETMLRRYLARLDEAVVPEPRLREIPVCYWPEYGPDLREVAELHKMTEDEVVHLHSSAEYIVYFLGFVPGFAYLGGLPPELETPRLASPRKSVPAGSVAIGGNQTGVYPMATPGGWRLIGRTPIQFFRPSAEEKSFLAIGDRVRFVPINAERFEAWTRA